MTLPAEPPDRIAGAYGPWQQSTVRCPTCSAQRTLVRTWTADLSGAVIDHFQCGACWRDWYRDHDSHTDRA